MRVGVYSDFSYRRDGDVVFADEAFSLFAAALAQHVDSVVLIGRLDTGSAHHPYALPERVGFVALPHYPTLSRPRETLRAALGSLRRFWGALDDLDTVWLLGPHPFAIAFALLAAARRRRVVLGTRQDFPAYVRLRHPRRRVLYAAALVLEAAWRLMALRQPVVVVGPELARKYAHSRRRLVAFVSLVPEATVTSAREALARPYDHELQLLSVGRLDAEKNPLLLADALAQLRALDSRWRLLVCGTGSMEAPLARRLAELGVDDHAELRGYVPFDQLAPLYSQSHVFLHVSWTEGVPQVLFEAFAAGLPVVATDVGGVGEVVGDAGLLIAPGDPASAAAAAQRVADDPALRARIIQAALLRAQRHTLEAETARVAAFLTASEAGGQVT